MTVHSTKFSFIQTTRVLRVKKDELLEIWSELFSKIYQLFYSMVSIVSVQVFVGASCLRVSCFWSESSEVGNLKFIDLDALAGFEVTKTCSTQLSMKF